MCKGPTIQDLRGQLHNLDSSNIPKRVSRSALSKWISRLSGRKSNSKRRSNGSSNRTSTSSRSSAMGNCGTRYAYGDDTTPTKINTGDDTTPTKNNTGDDTTPTTSNRSYNEEELDQPIIVTNTNPSEDPNDLLVETHTPNPAEIDEMMKPLASESFEDCEDSISKRGSFKSLRRLFRISGHSTFSLKRNSNESSSSRGCISHNFIAGDDATHPISHKGSSDPSASERSSSPTYPIQPATSPTEESNAKVQAKRRKGLWEFKEKSKRMILGLVVRQGKSVTEEEGSFDNDSTNSNGHKRKCTPRKRGLYTRNKKRHHRYDDHDDSDGDSWSNEIPEISKDDSFSSLSFSTVQRRRELLGGFRERSRKEQLLLERFQMESSRRLHIDDDESTNTGKSACNSNESHDIQTNCSIEMDDKSMENPLVKSFHSHYTRGRQLGKGAYASVFVAVENETQESYAVKHILDRAKMRRCIGRNFLVDEIANLKRLADAPHVVQFRDYFVDLKGCFVVLELMEGGELFERIIKKQIFSEQEARDACRCALSALNYMHQKRIAHRDLKPENLMLAKKDDLNSVKVCDFGFSKLIKKRNSCRTICGTPGYMAPEVLEIDPAYDVPCDIWSYGVMTFLLLSGEHPFDPPGASEQEVFELTTNGQFHFYPNHWRDLSFECKDIIAYCLKVNPNQRITAKKALDHDWFKSDLSKRKQRISSVMLASTVERMRKKKLEKREKEKQVSECISQLQESSHSTEDYQEELGDKPSLSHASHDEELSTSSLAGDNDSESKSVEEKSPTRIPFAEGKELSLSNLLDFGNVRGCQPVEEKNPTRTPFSEAKELSLSNLLDFGNVRGCQRFGQTPNFLLNQRHPRSFSHVPNEKTAEDSEGGNLSFEHKYEISEKNIQDTLYGQIHTATHKLSNVKYAVKRVVQRKLHHHDLDAMENEISALRTCVECSQIVNIHEVYKDVNLTHIVMEHIQGQPLIDRLHEINSLRESKIKDLTRNLLSGISYCHRQQIAIRNLSLENLIMVDGSFTDVKIVDFECAKKVTSEYSLRTKCGTVEYLAPEVREENSAYGLPCDIWSAGVIMFFLFGGYYPFRGLTEEEKLRNAQYGIYTFNEQYWQEVSATAIIVIKRMLTVDPQMRITAKDILHSRWLKADDSSPATFTSARKKLDDFDDEPEQLINLPSHLQASHNQDKTVGISLPQLTRKAANLLGAPWLEGVSLSPTY